MLEIIIRIVLYYISVSCVLAPVIILFTSANSITEREAKGFSIKEKILMILSVAFGLILFFAVYNN